MARNLEELGKLGVLYANTDVLVVGTHNISWSTNTSRLGFAASLWSGLVPH